MPRVLRIINRFNLGGPTFNVAYLSKYMAPEFETLLVGGQKDITEDSSEFILDKLGLEPVIIPEMRREISFKNDRIAYKKLKKLIAEFKPDIVHTHASKSGALGRLAAAKMNVPVITHTFHGHVFHSYFGKAKTEFYKKTERYLAKKSSSIIAISERQKEELSSEHKITSQDKLFVIPLGFDLQSFTKNQDNKRINFRRHYNIEENEVIISIVGRLVPIKNHKLFIDAIAKLKQESNINFRAFIVGDGELKQELFEYCKEKNLDFSENEQKATIHFTSWRKDIDVINAGSDIIALTSLNEGTPVSLIEAQASAKPIVSTRVGGIENVVLENKTALLSTSEDLNGFYNNLKTLLEDKNMREEFSRLGREHVLEKFHYMRLVNDMKAHYNMLLNR